MELRVMALIAHDPEAGPFAMTEVQVRGGRASKLTAKKGGRITVTLSRVTTSDCVVRDADLECMRQPP